MSWRVENFIEQIVSVSNRPLHAVKYSFPTYSCNLSTLNSFDDFHQHSKKSTSKTLVEGGILISFVALG